MTATEIRIAEMVRVNVEAASKTAPLDDDQRAAVTERFETLLRGIASGSTLLKPNRQERELASQIGER